MLNVAFSAYSKSFLNSRQIEKLTCKYSLLKEGNLITWPYHEKQKILTDSTNYAKKRETNTAWEE